MTGDGEPIFIYPTVLPTDDKEDTHPVLMASVCVSKDKCMIVELFFTVNMLWINLDVQHMVWSITNGSLFSYKSSQSLLTRTSLTKW